MGAGVGASPAFYNFTWYSRISGSTSIYEATRVVAWLSRRVGWRTTSRSSGIRQILFRSLLGGQLVASQDMHFPTSLYEMPAWIFPA